MDKKKITIKGTVLCNRQTSKTIWYQCCDSGTTGQGKFCWNYVRCSTLESMGIPIEQIAIGTGLSLEEIENF